MDYAVPNNFASEATKHGVVYNAEKSIGGIHYYDSRPRSVIIDKLAQQVVVKVEEPIVVTEAAKPVAETVAAKPAEGKLIIQRYDAEHPKPAEQEPEEEIEVATVPTVEEVNAVTETVAAIAELMPDTSIANEVAPIPEPPQEPFDAHKEALLAYQESMQELGVTKKFSLPKPKRNFGIYYSKPGAYVISVNGIPTDFSAVGINQVSIEKEDQIWLMKARKYFLEARDDQDRKIGSAEAYTTPELLEALWATAVQVGLDPKRFLVQVYNESRFNPHARGQAGERGIGQFMRNTALMLELDWERMSAGEETFAYQAKCAAEFVKSVGESRYNGGNPEYVRLISTRMSAISRTRVGDYACSSEACV